MGIITKEVELKFNFLKHNVRKYYTDLGYVKNEDGMIKVKTEDLTSGSGQKIEVKCDECGKRYFIQYNCYIKYNHNGKIYCQNCSNKLFRSGENSPVWNPNKTDEERLIGRHYEGYKQFIRRILFRDGYTCQCCGINSTKGHRIPLNVHHLDSYNWCVEKRIDDSNGITLCENCHKKFHDCYGYGDNTKEQFEEWIGKPIELLKSEYVEPKDCEIYCIEENKIYTIDEFCKEKEVNRQNVRQVCNLNNVNIKAIKGYHILYKKDYEKMTKDEIEKYLEHGTKRKIICIETNKIYDSIIEASKDVKISNGVINACCRGKIHTASGFHWKYLEDYEEHNGIFDFENENKIKRKIVCVETGEKFDSISEASKKYGISQSNISLCCNGKIETSKGYRWRYLEDYEKMTEDEINNFQKIECKKKVICIETNEIFESLTEACKTYNSSSISSLANCCLGNGHTFMNLHWKYLKDYEKMTEDEIKNLLLDFGNILNRKVVCLETSEIFNSITEASKKFQISYSSIVSCCTNRIYCANGFHWKYLEDYEKLSKKEIDEIIKVSRCKKIICLDTMEIFDSIADAQRKYNVNTISLCCRGKINSVNGLHWKYLEDYEKLSDDEIQKICSKSTFRKVVCLETKEKFNSIVEASKKYNAKNIRKSCKNHSLSSGGYHWVYLEDFEKMNENEIEKICDNEISVCRKIIWLETKQIFNSVKETSDFFGVKEETIRKHCLNKNSMSDNHVLYLDDYKKMSEDEIQKILNNFTNKCCKAVICLETNEKFDSMVDASKKYSVHAGSIGKCCSGKTSVCCGYHWKYLEDYEKMSKEEIDKLIS